jgi:multiple sugar transport system permease protein
MEKWEVRAHMHVGKRIQKMVCLGVLLAMAFLSLGPLVFLMGGSLMGSNEIADCIGPVIRGGDGYAVWRLFPMYPTLKHLVEVFFDSPEFFRMFWNSMKITAGTLLGQFLVGMPSAWGLAHYSFPGKKAVYMLYIVLMMMPFQVTMLSEYLVLDMLGIMDTLWAIILPGVFSTFSVFIMYRFFGGIPDAVIEAARCDGAGEFQIFWRIGIPLGSSGIISAMVLQFLECWNLMEQPMTFLKTKSLWPLSLYLPQISMEKAGFALCASMVTLLPALLVFLAGSDYLEQGIVAAAVKE